MVCEGYATLFSALLRRCNIPTFRYSTHRHCRNVGRIKDTKYNVDKIAVFDPTGDCSTIDENGYFMESDKFKYFMLSPEEIAAYDQYITIPTSLVIDYARTSNGTENDTLSILSRDLYETDLNLDYTADGYAITMLKLMGLNPKYDEFRDYREFLRELNNIKIDKNNDKKLINLIKSNIRMVKSNESKNISLILEKFKDLLNKNEYSELLNLLEQNKNVSNFENTIKIISIKLELSLLIKEALNIVYKQN